MAPGGWRKIEEKYPYITWHRDAGGRVAKVLVADASPRSDDEYWAHAELSERGSGGKLKFVPRSDEFIAAGDSHAEVVRSAKDWMRRNPRWDGKHGRYADNPADREFNFGGEFW